MKCFLTFEEDFVSLRGHVICSIFSPSKLKTRLDVISRYHEVVRSHFVNLLADNFKKVLDLDESTPEPAIRSGDTGQQIPCFDSCRLMTILMCNQFPPGLPK